MNGNSVRLKHVLGLNIVQPISIIVHHLPELLSILLPKIPENLIETNQSLQQTFCDKFAKDKLLKVNATLSWICSGGGLTRTIR